MLVWSWICSWKQRVMLFSLFPSASWNSMRVCLWPLDGVFSYNFLSIFLQAWDMIFFLIKWFWIWSSHARWIWIVVVLHYEKMSNVVFYMYYFKFWMLWKWWVLVWRYICLVEWNYCFCKNNLKWWWWWIFMKCINEI
jgi:hypothetical protein